MAGMVSNAIKCTPNDSPTTNEISNNQRSPRGSCKLSVHLMPNQNIADINSIAIAYTSASTALNQKLSEKV